MSEQSLEKMDRDSRENNENDLETSGARQVSQTPSVYQRHFGELLKAEVEPAGGAVEGRRRSVRAPHIEVKSRKPEVIEALKQKLQDLKDRLQKGSREENNKLIAEIKVKDPALFDALFVEIKRMQAQIKENNSKMSEAGKKLAKFEAVSAKALNKVAADSASTIRGVADKAKKRSAA